MKHFLNTQDWQRAELDALLADAARFKREPLGDALKGRSIALVFFNPSMRTRTSFELGAFQLGGHAIVLQPGKDAWPIEFDLGTVMDGDTEEHIAEVARVLGRYVDLIGVRAFPKFIDWQRDREDIVLKSFAKYSPVPVINMETITHPCQELAHALALQERFGTSDLRGKKYVLTWTYHPKPLNTAVANSALTIATRTVDHTAQTLTKESCTTRRDGRTTSRHATTTRTESGVDRTVTATGPNGTSVRRETSVTRPEPAPTNPTP